MTATPRGVVVLVVRAEPGATRTADRLRARGYQPILAPAQSVELLPSTEPLPSPDEIVAVTSPVGAARLAALVVDPDTEVWCVGDATAAAARKAGCGRVRSAGGDARALECAMARNCRPGARIVHLAAKEAGQRFVRAMSARGFAARALIVYRMRDRSVDPRVLASVTERVGCPPILLIHSAGAARSFARQVPPPWPPLRVVAISDSAAGPLAGRVDPYRLSVAARANEGAMFDLLGRAVTGGVGKKG